MKSFELAANIERVIRSLKNTWTIIKPAWGAGYEGGGGKREGRRWWLDRRKRDRGCNTGGVEGGSEEARGGGLRAPLKRSFSVYFS